MSNLVDLILSEVCIDERLSDGIFRIEEDEHMSALRDTLVRKGLTAEAAIEMSNKMLEGKYPERQAYNADGVLVTFPTPQHKAAAIKRGSHFEKNPNPQAVSTDKPKIEPKDDGQESEARPNIFEPDAVAPEKVQQGATQLDVEPPRGVTPPETTPNPPPQPEQKPNTPQYKAAEKEIAKKIFNSDDTALTNVVNPLTEWNNIELENKIRFFRNECVNIIDYLPFVQLQEVYKLLKEKYGK